MLNLSLPKTKQSTLSSKGKHITARGSTHPFRPPVEAAVRAILRRHTFVVCSRNGRKPSTLMLQDAQSIIRRMAEVFLLPLSGGVDIQCSLLHAILNLPLSPPTHTPNEQQTKRTGAKKVRAENRFIKGHTFRGKMAFEGNKKQR